MSILKAVNTATYILCGSTIGITLIDIISDRKIYSRNIAYLIGAGLAIIVATATSILNENRQLRAYDALSQLIEEGGFTPEILQNRKTRKMAKFFADEHNRVYEYKHTLETIIK